MNAPSENVSFFRLFETEKGQDIWEGYIAAVIYLHRPYFQWRICITSTAHHHFGKVLAKHTLNLSEFNTNKVSSETIFKSAFFSMTLSQEDIKYYAYSNKPKEICIRTVEWIVHFALSWFSNTLTSHMKEIVKHKCNCNDFNTLGMSSILLIWMSYIFVNNFMKWTSWNKD